MTINKKAPVRKISPKTRTNVGGSSLSKKSHVFNKRTGFIVAGLAAVAGLAFVALSFASGPSVKQYQYSANQCGLVKKDTNQSLVTSPTDRVQKCYNYSAEGFVFRLYKGVLGRNPDAGGYAYWTQQLAGDRTQQLSVVRTFMGVGQARGMSANLNNQAFVATLAKNFGGRTALVNYDKYWLRQLDSKKMTRSQVVLRYTSHNSSIKYLQASLLAYFQTAPLNKIVSHARLGEFASPVSTPTCTNGFVLKSKVISQTQKYYKGKPVSAYYCDSANSKQLGTVKQRTATLKCPTGFKESPWSVAAYKESTDTGSRTVSIGKACIKPGTIWMTKQPQGRT